MSENGEKCLSLFPRYQGEVIKYQICLHLKDIQFTVILSGVKKWENIHIWQTEIRVFCLKKWLETINKLIL